MRSYRGKTLILLTAFVITVTGAIVILRAQNGSDQSRNSQEKSVRRSDKLPVADYESPEPSDPDERAKRRAKNKKFNAANGVKLNPSEVDVSTKNNEWEWGLASALPAAQSSAIIIGEVLDARAHVSEDKTNVYSEFKVRVQDVLKNDEGEPIAVGDLIITERLGGRVKLSSGHIATYQIAGQGTPQTGQRYLFFLGFNPYEAGTKKLTGPRGNMNRHILTGYELQAGKVFPLDFGGKNFQDYNNKDESAFLEEVRRALASSTLQTSPE